MIEVLGWFAAGLVVVSFLFKDMFKLRVTNFSAALTWCVYGFLKEDNPLIVVNVLVMSIHLFWFYKNFTSWKS